MNAMHAKPADCQSYKTILANSRLTRLAMLAACLVLVAGFLVAPVDAQDRYWNNATNSLAWYELGFNWDGGVRPGPNERAIFQLGGTYEVWWDSATASTAPSAGVVAVAGGGNVSFVNLSNGIQHLFTINSDPGTIGLDVGGASLRINGLHVNTLLRSRVDPNGVIHVDGNHQAGTKLTIGSVNDVKGQLLATSGASLQTGLTWISGGGLVHIQGNGTSWSGGGMIVGEGDREGRLEITDGATVASSFVQFSPNYTNQLSTAIVSGAGSVWNNSAGIDIGYRGSIEVSNGGILNTADFVVGSLENGTGTASSNSGGLLFVSNNLQLGTPAGGTGVLNINDGTVRVAGNTTISPVSRVEINGGRFEFGSISMTDMARISGSSGSLAGTIGNAGYTNVASLTPLQNTSFDMTDVSLVNSGGLYGNAALGASLNNTATGEVETIGAERMRFAGGGTNAGQINIFGGQVRFGGDFLNVEGGEVNNFGNSFVADEVSNFYGLISGRGQFVANNGWYNQGVMAFSDGNTDIHGDVENSEGAQIVTSGNGTTTFYGDFYQQNAGELRTSAGSSTVFFGDVSGAGNYTGDGTVFMEGDLRPGNSPGTMNFGGDLVMSHSASLLIELGGLGASDFDQLLVAGDFALDGSQLNVALWNGFTLSSGMQFLFANVEGSLTGQFAGLGEGSLVGNFGGADLFITYNGFGGDSGVGLYTSAIPEPSALSIVGIALAVGAASRRRRRAC